MATRTKGAHGATAEGTTAAEGTGLAALSPQERASELACRGSVIAAAVLIISTLLPWVSVIFFSAATLVGVRVWEGRVTLILAIVAGAFALGALYWGEMYRRTFLVVSTICAVLAFIATIAFGFRFRDALNIPAILGESQALTLARAGAGLDAGWYLALVSSAVLAGLGLWGYFSGRGTRPARAVPNMEWVEPGTPQSQPQSGRQGQPQSGGGQGAPQSGGQSMPQSSGQRGGQSGGQGMPPSPPPGTQR